MRLCNITLVTTLGLLAAACEKPLPTASTISSAEIADALLTSSHKEHGRVGVYFEKIDLKAYAYAMDYSGCEALDPEVDLTAPYQNTMFAGLKQGYSDLVFLNTSLTAKEMENRNIQAQVYFKNPSAFIRHLTESSNMAVAHKAFVSFDGTIIISNQSGTVRQQNLNIQSEGTQPPDYLGSCNTLAELIVHTATKATKKFALKSIATSKDMINALDAPELSN